MVSQNGYTKHRAPECYHTRSFTGSESNGGDEKTQRKEGGVFLQQATVVGLSLETAPQAYVKFAVYVDRRELCANQPRDSGLEPKNKNPVPYSANVSERDVLLVWQSFIHHSVDEKEQRLRVWVYVAVCSLCAVPWS